MLLTCTDELPTDAGSSQSRNHFLVAFVSPPETQTDSMFLRGKHLVETPKQKSDIFKAQQPAGGKTRINERNSEKVLTRSPEMKAAAFL